MIARLANVTGWTKDRAARTPEALGQHVKRTYSHLRWGMVLVAFALPLVLWRIGQGLFQIDLQGSMSAYYRTDLRDVFVGALWAIGICLLVYKGYSFWEDQLLNIAGLCSILVALFPLDWSPYQWHVGGFLFNPHVIAAVLFFVSCSCVCAFQARKTLTLEGTPPRHLAWLLDRGRLTWWYHGLGFGMVVVPVGIWVWVQLYDLSQFRTTWLFWAETAAFYIFVTYWVVKSLEIQYLTRAEEKALTLQATQAADGSIVQATADEVAESYTNVVAKIGGTTATTLSR